MTFSKDLQSTSFRMYFTQLDINIQKLALFSGIISLILHLIVAIQSEGIYHPDEYYQIYEFAAAKLGLTEINLMPWEYSRMMRPTLQPWAIIGLIKLFNLKNPHIIMLIMRLLISFFSWVAIWAFTFCSMHFIKSNFAKIVYLLMVTFFAELFSFHARFSSENVSAIFILFSFCLLLSHSTYPNKGNKSSFNWKLFFAGLFIGLSVVFRLQMILFLPGIFIWSLFNKFKIKEYLLVLIGFGLSISILILCDYYFYNQLVFSPFNYYYQNMILGMANNYGISPWYFYLQSAWALHGLSFIFVILAFVICTLFRIKNILILSLIPFILVHFLINHKEPRFLFALFDFLPFIIALALEIVIGYYKKLGKINKPILYLIFLVVLGANLPYIGRLLYKPCSMAFPIYRYLYHHPIKKGLILMQGFEPYSLTQLRASPNEKPFLLMNFLHPNESTIFRSFITEQDFQKNIDTAKSPIYLISDLSKNKLEDNFKSFNLSLKAIYVDIPPIFRFFDYYHWIDRTSFSGIYLIKRKKSL